MNEFRKKLIDPPKKYRPAPFWSWNEKLDPEETRRQIRQMDEAGLGGFFMHARGGLQTEYLSDEWFDNVAASLDEGGGRGMYAWGYDENGWPSGFGGGAVPGLGRRYQQKYLRCKEVDSPAEDEFTLINVAADGKILHCYFDVNPFYVDTMDPEVTREFLRSTHEKYRGRLGEDFRRMQGFFTDEPQASRNGIPWSFNLEKEYERIYGGPIRQHLPKLFFRLPGYEEFRFRYWRLVRELFTDSYMGVIGGWCRENGCRLTGHMVLEEGYWEHIHANGCCMPSYEFMDIPGMDHLCRELPSVQTEMQLTSAANQLGKKQVLSETFAACGWNVSFEDMRRIYEHQLVHGVNLLCQHLEGYSLRGIRKRDYPASLFRHQPWWKDYRVFNDMVSRIGMLIAEGEVRFPVLVLHTIESGWLVSDDREETDGYASGLLAVMEALESGQLQYHLGESRIMERHGRAENGRLIVGTQSYSAVVVPPAKCFDGNTFRLLKEFRAQGGEVIFSGEIPEYIDGVRSGDPADFAGDCTITDIAHLAESIPAECRLYSLQTESEGSGNGSDGKAAGGADGLMDDSGGQDGSRQKAFVRSTLRHFPDQGMTMYYVCNFGDEDCRIRLGAKGKSAAGFDAVSRRMVPARYERSGDSQVSIGSVIAPGTSAVFFVYEDPERADLLLAEDDTPAKENRLGADDRFAEEGRPGEDGRPGENAAGRAGSCALREKLAGRWKVASAEPNSLTLDYCDVVVDGETVQEGMPVSDVQELLCAYGRKVRAEIIFRFDIMELTFGSCELVIETPEIFDITLNGHPVPRVVTGFAHDACFKTIDIRSFLCRGTNELRLGCDFEQSEATYRRLESIKYFESNKNSLTYDMEVEAVYLRGDFGVFTDRAFEELDRGAVRTGGGFYLAGAPDSVFAGTPGMSGRPDGVLTGSLERQGYPFFAGSITLAKKMELTAEEARSAVISFARLPDIVAAVSVNGLPAGKIMWKPYSLDISRFVRAGSNEISVTLTGSLRNLLGPHHLSDGETYIALPFYFFRRTGIWGWGDGLNRKWTDEYSFVARGLFFE